MTKTLCTERKSEMNCTGVELAVMAAQLKTKHILCNEYIAFMH